MEEARYYGLVVGELTALAARAVAEWLPDRVASLRVDRGRRELRLVFEAVGEGAPSVECAARPFEAGVLVECRPGCPQLALAVAGLLLLAVDAAVARLDSTPGYTRVALTPLPEALALAPGTLTASIFTFYKPGRMGLVYETGFGLVIGECILEGCEGAASGRVEEWRGRSAWSILGKILGLGGGDGGRVGRVGAAVDCTDEEAGGALG